MLLFDKKRSAKILETKKVKLSPDPIVTFVTMRQRETFYGHLCQ